jgi:hypothetical protein
MVSRRPFWFLLNIYGWIVFVMSLVTAAIIGEAWVILLGVIGYLLALLVDLIGGGSLGRTGAIRLARAEQENRELHAEQARLIGGLKERDERLSVLLRSSPPQDQAAELPDADIGKQLPNQET